MSCNCKNHTINMGSHSCCPSRQFYYTKGEIDEMISGGSISSGEVQSMINASIPTNVSAFNNDVPYVSDVEMEDFTYDKETIDRKIASGGTFDPSAYYNKYDVDNLVQSAMTEVEGEIPTVPTNVSAFVNDVPYLTQHQSLSNYYTKQETSGKTEIANALNQKANRSEIPTVPTKVSAFINDVPYLTEHQSLSGYVTDDEMENYTYDKETIDRKVASGGTFDPTNYYTKSEVYNKSEVDNLIPTVPTKVSQLQNDVPYLVASDIAGKQDASGMTAYATTATTNALSNTIDNHTSNNAIHVTQSDKTIWNNKSDFSGDYNDLRNKPTIPTVPTNVSAFVNDVPYLTEHQDLSDYATKEYVSGYTYDKNEIDRKVASGGTFDPTAYYTKIEVNNLVESAKTDVESEIPSLDGYATQQWVEDKHYISGVDLSDYVTEAELTAYTYDKSSVDTALDTKLDVSAYTPTDLSKYWTSAQTVDWVEGQGYLTEHQSLSAYSTTDEVNSAIATATNDMATETWVQNQGYLTQHQSLSAYSTTDEVNSAITEATSGLQETLVAGSGITISGNVISASGGGGGATYTAGDGIDISENNVISTTTKFWCGSQAQWSVISGDTDANTVYMIYYE